ncbi:hypothetical protein [Pinisolibacter aquiterrae]|uniref:hypothetical protein n=1 Tax=Pinisolibacter aquiterrae TaxID=2815579 RepID=UPI001C3CFBB7|nr:hypothetical protein [Pinisolibacter aquiterrae]MBV5263196.1 hypothetical protein [Pinisolibacter aquiterrae]MCC8234110.1 hypothetical protein [Pinisolibacter aquiterrae]
MTRPTTDVSDRPTSLDEPPVWRAGERERILPRLVPVTPGELADRSREGRARILDRVVRALGSERRRGRARHWSYSLDRHVGLIRALAAEADLWRRESGSPWWPGRAGGRPRPSRSAAAERRAPARLPEDAKRRGS